MSIKVLPLVEYPSYVALVSFQHLMLGLKMIPEYASESFEGFMARIQALPHDDQIMMVRKAAMFVKMDREDIESILYFCTDKNGVRYSKENMKNLGPDEIIDMIVAVCAEIIKMKTNFLSEKEKKN